MVSSCWFSWLITSPKRKRRPRSSSAARPGRPAPCRARSAVGPGVGRRQQRQLDAAGAGVHERVVEAVDSGRQHARAVRVAAAQQPQLFLLPDMGEVPHQRAHQRVVLAVQFGVVEIDEPQRALAGPRQFAGQRLACRHSPLAPVGDRRRRCRGRHAVGEVVGRAAALLDRTTSRCIAVGEFGGRVLGGGPHAPDWPPRAAAGRARPSRAARSHAVATGSTASAAMSAATGSSSSVTSVNTTAGQTASGTLSR